MSYDQYLPQSALGVAEAEARIDMIGHAYFDGVPYVDHPRQLNLLLPGVIRLQLGMWLWRTAAVISDHS